ncbi:ribosomal protein L7/L12 C-terminal domain-containing protein [Hyaloraphidium curvatum]|nr:ribosomal protein L7/L12 C-terminal domain-containing protein [Hyaloraphidium curvatum]
MVRALPAPLRAFSPAQHPARLAPRLAARLPRACAAAVPARARPAGRDSRRRYSTAPSPKVAGIVDGIAGLTLLETAELISALKTKLNITEIAMPVAAAPAAPAAAAAAPAAAEAPKAEAAAPEKASFTLKLESFAADAKAKVIREIKNIVPGINLVDAKKFAESVPKVLREDVPKAEAEKIKKALEDIGAKVLLE